MGSSFSSSPTATAAATTKVILPNGSLREYSSPVPVSSVLSSIDIPSCFLCNSNSLYFDEHIPAMASEVFLQSDQIYFVLPASKLKYPLSGSEMAALAMRATSALARNSKRKTKSNRRGRVMPVEEAVCEEEESRIVTKRARNLRRGRMVYRAHNRVRLGTIEEGDDEC